MKEYDKAKETYEKILSDKKIKTYQKKLAERMLKSISESNKK